MTKHLFAVFAHPDDEAFGPIGTLLMKKDAGYTIHLICITNGGAGRNPDQVSDLGSARLEEWHAVASLIGASSTHYLGMEDGALSNTSMVAVAERVERIIRDTAATDAATEEITMITYAFDGVTGHIDHIVAARAASLAFYRLHQDATLPMRQLWLYALADTRQPTISTDWLFVDTGAPIGELYHVDATHKIDTIRRAIQMHQTQRFDITRLLSTSDLGHDYFYIRY